MGNPPSISNLLFLGTVKDLRILGCCECDLIFTDSLLKELMPKPHICDVKLSSHAYRNYRHSVTKEGMKNLIKDWCRIPLDQRKDRMSFRMGWRERYDLEGTTALIQSVPNWVWEIKNEEGGDEFRNIQQGNLDSDDETHAKLTLAEGGKELEIWLRIF